MHKAKKSLGQNFLKSDMAIRKIIEAGDIKSGDIILEIGPGRGALTSKLLEKAGLVIAVEKDYELFGFLKGKFSENIKSGSLILLQGDILEFNINETISNFSNGLAGGGTRGWNLPEDRFQKDLRKISKLFRYKIIANIPYNITGAILKKFLTENPQPEAMVLMVQHEVATRILARDGKESILSISVKAYGEPKMIVKVDKRYFSPAPKVNSAVIKISNISRKMFGENKINEERFWEIVKVGFAHKRKKLSGNLKNVVPAEKLKNPILKDKRAEDLSLADWINLCN